MKTISFILILLCLISFPNTAHSTHDEHPQQFGRQQPNCMPYKRFIDVLKKEYTEVLNFRGITEDGKVLMEVWINKDSGSFTIIRVIIKEKHKLVCASIGGEAWHEAEENKKKEPKL
jgi:hypothetical protein